MATNVRVELRQYHGSNQYDKERAALSLIRQFKRAVNEAGVLHTLKEFYEKPGEKRRRKKRYAELRRKYAAQAEQNGTNRKKRHNKDRRGFDE
jgi:ribosomal protein S21